MHLSQERLVSIELMMFIVLRYTEKNWAAKKRKSGYDEM